ncbi:MAG: hypothetical protein BWY72_01737 [Bacteroidetes bacterium ADurb.Bin416]|nr:MAG: hypothetical protein BWY72_01737 [Bacteroidetes bacterium ADurb.Bin416]
MFLLGNLSNWCSLCPQCLEVGISILITVILNLNVEFFLARQPGTGQITAACNELPLHALYRCLLLVQFKQVKFRMIGVFGFTYN